MFYPQFSSVVFQDDVSAQVHGFSQTWPWFGFLSDAMMGPRPVGHCHSWMPYEQIGELMSSLNIATKTYLKVLPYNKKTKNEYKKKTWKRESTGVAISKVESAHYSSRYSCCCGSALSRTLPVDLDLHLTDLWPRPSESFCVVRGTIDVF